MTSPSDAGWRPSHSAQDPAVGCELIAHRGESQDAPENTLAAVNLAWQRGATSVEIDVHLTRDRRLAVIHDQDTHRTTGGAAKLLVACSTFDELRACDVGRWSGPQFAGQHVPLVEEVIATIPRGRRLVIEIKPGPEAVNPLAEAIESSGLPIDHFAIISFNADALRATRQRLPPVHSLYLSFIRQDKATGRWSPTAEELIDLAHAARADGVGVSACEAVTADFVAAFKRSGLACTVWTVDSAPQACRMIAAGVDAITTNRAAWLRQQLIAAAR